MAALAGPVVSGIASGVATYAMRRSPVLNPIMQPPPTEAELDDAVLTDLRFISQLKVDEYICVSERIPQAKAWYLWMVRWWYGEDRKKTLDFLKNRIGAGLQFVSTHLDKSEYEDRVMLYIKQLMSCLNGLANLQQTYRQTTDRHFQSQLETEKANILLNLRNLYHKKPDLFDVDIVPLLTIPIRKRSDDLATAQVTDQKKETEEDKEEED